MCGPLSSILTQSRRLELNITFLHQILLHFISVEGVGHVRGSSRYFQHTPQSGRLHRVEMWKGRAEGMLCFYCDSAPFLSLRFCTFFIIFTILHLFDDINYCESAPNIYYLLSGLQEVCSEGQALQKTQRRVQGHDAGTEAAAHLWGRVWHVKEEECRLHPYQEEPARDDQTR